MRRQWMPMLLPLLLAGCPRPAEAPPVEALVLATTTSTYDTGLLDRLIPPFEARHGIEVKVVAVGTGEALELGRRGNADVLLVHAPAAEEVFVAEGHGVDRWPVMWNDFVLVGPPADSAAVQGTPLAEALRKVAASGALWVSRGDHSGTHKKERGLWAAAGILPSAVLETGQGMAATLRIAHEKAAYTLTDRGTYLALQPRIDGLTVLVEGDVALANPYHVMRVSPLKHPAVHQEMASALVEYLTGAEAAALIDAFRANGQQLFHAGALPAPAVRSQP